MDLVHDHWLSWNISTQCETGNKRQCFSSTAVPSPVGHGQASTAEGVTVCPLSSPEDPVIWMGCGLCSSLHFILNISVQDLIKTHAFKNQRMLKKERTLEINSQTCTFYKEVQRAKRPAQGPLTGWGQGEVRVELMLANSQASAISRTLSNLNLLMNWPIMSCCFTSSSDPRKNYMDVSNASIKPSLEGLGGTWFLASLSNCITDRCS